MRRTTRAGAATALLLAGATVAVASTTAQGEGKRRVEVIRAVVENVPANEVALDLDHSGPGAPNTPGDQLIFSANLLIDGKQIGTDGGACTVVRLEPPLWSCVSTNRLPRGTLTAHGLLDLSQSEPPFRLAITGGTGAYRDAGGHVEVEFDNPDPDHDQVTFRILHLRR